MRYSYEYNLVDGHIIVCDAKRQLLLDTGAPLSVGSPSPLAFAGQSHQVQDGYMGITPASLSENIGTSVSTLIGADIINRYDMQIDPATHELVLTEGELHLDGNSLEVDNFMGIPVIEATIGQDTVRLFFDTGAKLSYLDPDKTNSLEPTGTASDFYPSLGTFSTNTFDVAIGLASENIVLRVGNLPVILQETLRLANVQGILGTALLQAHKITFAPRRHMMTMERLSK